YGVISHLFLKLQLTKLYQSWWYISLLIFFSLNIFFCILSRSSPKFRKAFTPSIRSSKKAIQAAKIKDTFKKPWPIHRALDSLTEELKARKYRIKRKQEENQAHLLARKRLMGIFGSAIVHLGLLVILAGGITSGLGSFRTQITLTEGETKAVPESGFDLRLDKFEIERYPGGEIKDWKSTLTVIENSEEQVSRIIEVNHPLTYQGYVFYQSSYGWNWNNPVLEIEAVQKSDPSFRKKINISLGEKAEIEKGLYISALHFVPDFVINENNQVATRSLQPNNPAAFIEGRTEEEKIFSGWIFARYPDFSRIHSRSEQDYNFLLKNFQSGQYSGIQIAKDPGTNIIWVGCTLLMIGLFFAFYWPEREIRAFLEKIDDEKTEIAVSGSAKKNKESFLREFEDLVLTIRRKK
ncbi:MAG: cytochrome c biogenesis protein ResB, partial [Acidobacteriota bacterium]